MNEQMTFPDKMGLHSGFQQNRNDQQHSQRSIQDEGSKWKSKSLNSLPTQHYQIDLQKSLIPKQELSKPLKKGEPTNDSKSSQGMKVLPLPKIKKLNQKSFCITIQNQLTIFYHLDNNEKTKLKTKKNFGNLKYQLPNNIQFTLGNGSNLIFIGMQNQLIILEINKKDDKYFITQKTQKTINNIKAVTFIGDDMIVVSNQHVYQYSQQGTFELLTRKFIQFASENDRKLFNQLKSINLVVQSMFCFYFFGTKVQQKIDYNFKRKFAMDAPPPSKMCQILHIVKFIIDHNSDQIDPNSQIVQVDQKKPRILSMTQILQKKILSIQLQIYPIDHVFETGIFQKSKIFEIDESIFLMSLHEQIILIKKHFNKFIVWDNVSIISSKSQQKKGQLILADKRILVYSENGQIFAHDIFFKQTQGRINMPTIDSFKGNDNDQEILYDAVLLQYDKESLMKVLFYFKEVDVMLPNKSKYKKQADNPNDHSHQQNLLHFTMLCINQSDPKQKLMQMLRAKKQPNEIAEFCERFKIISLQKTKCMWSVSEKNLKDIENVLLQISDDKYIQTQLDNILKKQPHNLTFLISVQKKQVARLKKLIVRNLLKDSETTDSLVKIQNENPRQAERKRKQYLLKVIQWLMQSIMFEKKLQYSKNFLSFKEYDFIQIGKLKAASLKQQIKLLSCKKYQKRLKYFLNSFKILAIANWQQIFRFLLLNKNQIQIKQFLKDFRFILPEFVQTSNVFQQKNQYRASKHKNHHSFKQVTQDDDHCYLWDDLQQIFVLIEQALKNAGQTQKLSHPPTQQGQKPLNTIQDFQQMIIQNLRSLKRDIREQNESIQSFKQILSQVVQSVWFKNAAFKQHSMLNKTSKQLQQQFHELKNKKAYQILVKYLYQQIQRGSQDVTNSGVNNMLEQFVQQKIIPESFKKNDDARLQVYKILQRIKMSTKEGFNLKKSVYLVMNQDQYFYYLFQQIKSEILKSIKSKYDDVQEGFFRQRFQIYLKSKYVNLREIINFLDQFQSTNADDVRLDVFNCIKRLLKLGDYQNTRNFILKSLDKQVLPQRAMQMQPQTYQMNLRQQAKIPYGFVFYNFFKAFNLDYTYQQLIQATKNSNLSSNNFLKQLIFKYCSDDFQIQNAHDATQKRCIIQFQDNKIINQKLNSVDIYNKPLQFFGILLYLVDMLDFQVQQIAIYHLMIQIYLNKGKQDQKQPNINNKQNNKQKNNNQQNQQLYPTFGKNQSKFDQLFNFVKSIDNYIMTGEDLNTKNYILINDFKQENDAQQMFVNYTIQWISQKYSSIKKPQEIQPTLLAIKKVLQILQKSNKSSRKIKQVDAFYRLLQFLKKFDNKMMMKIDLIKQQMSNSSGFIFLMHMFVQIGVQNFVTSNLQKPICQQPTIRISQRQSLSNPSVQTNTKIYNWMCIFSQFKIIKGEQNIDQTDHPQFIRFVVEVCCIMVREKKMDVAWELLIRAVNQACYFRDAFYYLVTQMKIEDKDQFRDAFKTFLSTETAKNLKVKLTAMLKGGMQSNSRNRVLSFPPLTKASGDSKQHKQVSNSKVNAIFLFRQLLQSNRGDQAFFFLVRIKKTSNSQIQQISFESKRLSNISLFSYLLLTSYMKNLQSFISSQFHPSFLFFKSKFQILIDNIQRKDIIKDINIAISRLKQKQDQQKNISIKKEIQESKSQLEKYYFKYMKCIQQDPIIRLTQEDEEQAARRIQMYARMVPDLVQEQTKQQSHAKIKLQENQQKLQKVHQNNKLNVIHKQIAQSVTEAKRAADKYAAVLQQKKRQASKMTYAQKKQQQLIQIKRKEQQDVSTIKDSFKSATTQKVNDLIEKLRRKREQISENRVKSSMIRDYQQKNLNIPSKDMPNININIRKPDQLQQLPSSKYNPAQFTRGNKLTIGDKRKQTIEEARRSYLVDNESRPSQKYMEMQHKVKKMEQPSSNKYKVTLEQISQLFSSKEPQALKYLQKFDLIKQNMQVGVQLLKRVYSIIKDLSNFMQFLRYLFSSDERYKQVLEQKSIAIVSQMVKMDQKINLKELIPVQLFTNVQNVSIKDYYNVAYEIIKPHLKKILAQQNIAAHALGILMRYSLGSQTKYFHKVFADYISVMLKNYQLKIFQQKQTFLLAEKLRSQFTNLDSQNREFLFEKLINQVSNEGKKKRLIQALKKAIQRKSDSALGGSQNQQIIRALTRLQK